MNSIKIIHSCLRETIKHLQTDKSPLNNLKEVIQLPNSYLLYLKGHQMKKMMKLIKQMKKRRYFSTLLIIIKQN